MNKIYHERLGEIEVLFEAEFGINKMTYVSAYRIPVENKKTETIEWRFPRYGSRSKHYYALWGNVDDLNTRGITHITTKSGRIPRNPNKYFFRLLESSKNVKYKR
jgi:hypothetical protein